MMFQHCLKFARKVYCILFPLNNFISKIKWWNSVVFQKNVRIYNSCFAGKNGVFSNSYIRDSYIGKGTYINTCCRIQKALIGNFCSIADNVFIGFGAHPTRLFVSTYPAFYYNTTSQIDFSFHKESIPLFDAYTYVDLDNKYLTQVGNDVWIGSHALIMDGVKIGDGAIIAAGSIVTKDVAPYAIVGGIPAKTIRYRFSDLYIKFLLDFAWWNRDFDWIETHYMDFLNIDSFYTQYSKEDI